MRGKHCTDDVQCTCPCIDVAFDEQQAANVQCALHNEVAIDDECALMSDRKSVV